MSKVIMKTRLQNIIDSCLVIYIYFCVSVDCWYILWIIFTNIDTSYYSTKLSFNNSIIIGNMDIVNHLNILYFFLFHIDSHTNSSNSTDIDIIWDSLKSTQLYEWNKRRYFYVVVPCMLRCLEIDMEVNTLFFCCMCKF